MKKLLLLMLVAGLTAACSSTDSSNQGLSSNVEAVVPTITVVAVAQDNYPVPRGNEAIEQSGTYRTISPVYDKTGKRVLIPKNAIISGTYRNNGEDCRITWDLVYANKRDYNKDDSMFAINQITRPSFCNPARGVRSGNIVTISFTRNNID